ncbi:MAG: LCP family protein [Chloroflexota bacterium]|nr:LCP family protein [Chloroflexota bacterium]
MNEAQRKYRFLTLSALIFLMVTLIGLGLQGCQLSEPTAKENVEQPNTEANSTLLPILTLSFLQPTLVNAVATSTLVEIDQSIWEDFAPPSIDPATPIPPPLGELALSDEIMVWILLGSDAEPPFTGRTQAIHLLFIHPRFSKASLVSIPGDLYVYIPGYTMQRLNIAYALGGIETLRSTLAYNFGVSPSRFVLAHPGDFQWLIDDIDGVEATVFFPLPQACGGLRPGEITMDGSLALCYASYRNGMDEFDRMRRQQQLLQIIFRKLTRDGNLIRLPLLYASYEGWVKTDLSLSELMGYVPLALRLADQDRISYYMIGWEQVQLWEVPGHSQAQVFLPVSDGIMDVLQNAIDDVMIPKPFTNQVQTLEAQITAAYLATASPIPPTLTTTPSPTPSPTITTSPTMTGTITGTVTEITLSPSPSPTTTLTPPGYP